IFHLLSPFVEAKPGTDADFARSLREVCPVIFIRTFVAYSRDEGSDSLFRGTQIARAQLQPASGSTIGIEVGGDVVGVRQTLCTALDVELGVASGAFCVKRRAGVGG